MKIGYARVSSVGQSLELQIEQLTAAGCEKIYQEKRSGRSAVDRPELAAALDQVRAGDVLVTTRLDRLARSVPDLYAILQRLTREGAGFTCLQQSAVDTATPMGKLMLGILGSVAEFENDLRRERQREGIDRAKQKGVYRGRKREIDRAQLMELRKTMGPAELARALGIGRASVYRIIEEEEGKANLAESIAAC